MTGLAAPAVEVRLDGTVLPAGVRVLGVRVRARFGAPAQCEVEVYAPDGHPAWPEPARLGGGLAVAVAGAGAPLFTGEVTGVELSRAADGTTTTRIRGYDLLHRLRKRQKLRVLESVTAATVARLLTADLPVEVAGGPDTVLDRVVQHRQSDFELLVEVAARTGCLVAMDGPVLRLSTLEGHGAPVPLVFGDSLFEAAVEANLEQAAGRVTATGWDAETAQPVRAVADAPRCGRRIGYQVPAAADLDLVEHPATAVADVAAAAQLVLDTRAAAGVVLRGVAAGDPRLCAGSRVEVTGAGPTVDGRYVVCEVIHHVDANGFQSTFSTDPPAPPAPAAHGTSVTLGRVTAVDDPQRRGRVRVSLPAIGDLDAGWLGVVCPGAGRGKGLVALPDVGDTVAVALPHADPTAGLVLGSLYGALAPPDTGVAGDAVRRWSLRTADGQAIVLDDAAHSLRLDNHDGSFIELAPHAVRINAATALVLDAAGHAVTIRARSVDFEHAVL